MNFVADQRAKRLVDELVPGERPLALEFARDDHGLEMGIVIAGDPDDRIVESGLDEPADFLWIHSVKMAVVRGAQCTGKAYGFPTPGADCV